MADVPNSGPPDIFRLMDLPNELIKTICDNDEFDIKALKALRLTNKLLSEFVTKRFGKQSFCNITVLMSRFSLQAFCELSHHPSFGPVVEKVNLSPMFVPQCGIEGLPTPKTHGTMGAGRSVHRTKSLQSVRRGFLNRMCEERETETFGCAQRMLAIAFKAFALRGQWLFLEFWNNEECAIGANHLLHNEDYGTQRFWHLEWQTTIESTIKAASSQGCKIKGLLFCCDGRRQDTTNYSSLCTDNIGQPLDFVCSQLTHLEIEFENEDFEATTISVKRMVSAAHNLKVLRLYELSDYDNAERHLYLRDILNCVASSSLQCIHLGLFQMPESDLFTFLKRYSSTLKELKLLNVCLFTEDCISLIAWIKKNLLSLLHFNLDEFCLHSDRTRCCNEDDFRDEYLVDHGEDMQARLADILAGERKMVSSRVEEVDV